MEINNENLISGLQKMGFTERQAKVYSAMLMLNDASLSDIHKKSGVPHNKIKEVVYSLVRLGYCSEKQIKSRTYYNIVNPKASLRDTIETMQDDLDNSKELVNNIEELFKNSETSKEPLEYIEVIRGNANIHARYCELITKVQHELLGFTKPPWAARSAEELKEQGDIFTDFIKKGAISRSIYEVKERNDPKSLEILETAIEKGEECRVYTSLPLKMFIFDRKLLLIADASDSINDNSLSMTLISQQTIVNAFIALFEFFWQKSEDVNVWKQTLDKKKDTNC